VGNILVAGLTIKPGVTVLFANNYTFEVGGKLKAIGTPDSPILFTTTNSGWQGIYFNAAQAGCELAHCTVERAVNSGIRIVNSTPVISDCVIRSNSMSVSGAPTVQAYGGGINTDSPLVLDSCTIVNNSVAVSVTDNNAAAYAKGGGVYTSAALQLKNCVVSSNSVSATATTGLNATAYAWAEGGGIYGASSVTIRNSIIKRNTAAANTFASSQAYQSYARSFGAGVSSLGTVAATNTIFSYNAASGSAYYGWNLTSLIVAGGGQYATGSGGNMVNCTFFSNSPSGIDTTTNGTVVLSSIFWSNVTSQVVGTTNVTYSDVQGGMTGVGNVNLNPLFLSPDDLIIVSGSPCVNAGSTNSIYKNVYFPPSLGHTRNDMGAHGGPGAGARFRYRLIGDPQFEVVLLGCVPGYTYLIQASTNVLDWQTVQQASNLHVGDVVYYLEPSINTLPRRFYKLNLAP
jgi:hypothetical protein